MGDPAFVDGQVRAMADELRVALFEAPEGSNPQAIVVDIAKKYADLFCASNTDFIQTMTPEAQSVWLREHGLGNQDPPEDLKSPVTCLVSATLKKLAYGTTQHAEQQIDDEQLQFILDTGIEDCTCMLLGIENYAD